MQKLISIVTPCYNEEENIKILCEKIKEIFLNLNYDYEHIVIDNKSTDKTRKILRSLAEKDKNLKLMQQMYKDSEEENKKLKMKIA